MKVPVIKAGDVIRVPGYPGVENPARINIIKDADEIQVGSLCLRSSEAIRMAEKYCVFKPEFNGSFWAIERDRVEIFPTDPADQGAEGDNS